MPLPSDFEKGSHDHIEDSTANSPAEIELGPEHEAYLIERHGTVFLDPLPSSDPADPLNWPDWKKNSEILLLAFQTFSSTFMAGGLTPAFEPMAAAYNISTPTAAYLTSAQIAVLGGMPLIWLPIMNAYGRNGFLSIASLLCCALNIGGGFAKTYGQQMATRVLVACFISTCYAAGSCVVGDLSFAHERGKKNGWWSVGLVLGTTAGPFFCGFIQQHAGTKWIYFVFAIMNFVQSILWYIADETVYVRHHDKPQQTNWILSKVLRLNRNPDQELSFALFLRPFKLFWHFNVMMTTLAISVVFCYANIVLIVELPQAMGILFNLDAQQISYQFIALIIGSTIGEFLAGPLSDWWMKKSIARRGGERVIVDRLWVSYNGFIFVVIGLVIWGVYLNKATPGHWIIAPIIGAAIAACGNNICMTILITFAIDSDPKKATDIGLFVTFVRQIFAFCGPFYFPYMFDNLKFNGSAGLMCGLVVVFGAGVVIITHIVGLRQLRVGKN
ncbi:major facilitator superfamily domain-containing protein [Scheffersomyces coipomensis]|uniref:major facilitator superfamily domain-containing protein n=1 Tax=Scheffersomyces coipomensis TaxID=1788519 RepID=UPI00315D847F